MTVADVTTSVRIELAAGFRSVAMFHEAAGNAVTAEQMRAHAADLARLEGPELLERAEAEGDLLCRCAHWAPFVGRQQ